MATTAAGGVVPAQLGFLAIFNPSLGNTDETIDDQIVYYASITTQTTPHKRKRMRGRPTDNISQEERHERLRQIGLAQGMANFTRDFSHGAAVDTIDTEKSRLVLHELEPGWWILVSIDLTKVPLPPRLPTKNGEVKDERFEYSTKEMKPATLLLRDLLRAHSIFLMHHDSSLSALFVRTRRSKFVAVLSRYWDLYLSTWNVLLHGNPIRNVFGGINIAASGELGMGVGEEDRGSGEREVLEGLVGRIEGLDDVVVSKFGDYDRDKEAGGDDAAGQMPWLGTGKEPAAEDGAIFLGTGALSRKSLRDVTHWMEDLYTWGEHAYGVIDSPTSIRRAKPRTTLKSSEPKSPGESPSKAQHRGGAVQQLPNTQELGQSQPSGDTEGQVGDQGKQESGIDKMVSYLKLGYGSYWSIPGVSSESTTSTAATPSKQQGYDATESNLAVPRPSLGRRTSSSEAAGHYLIGLKGDIEETNDENEWSNESDDVDTEHNSRTVLRTVHVELESEAERRAETAIVRDFQHPGSILTRSQVVGNMLPGYDSHDLNKAMKLRVVVYVNRPFIFVFLFRLRTDSLAWDTLYRSLHHQISPLRKHLLASTKYRAERPNVGPVASSIDDLIWDPTLLTVRCTIPNIPDHYQTAQPWSRVDAISTHLNLLNLYGATRSRLATELERTQKTSRGWWIVWTRLMDNRKPDNQTSSNNLSTIHEAEPRSDASSESPGQTQSELGQDEPDGEDDGKPTVSKEIFLIRCASDHARFRGVSGSHAEPGGLEGAGKLAQGIGVDTRRYVEDLLSLL
ncbi:hypothetical protein S7711_00033 [Stachybotrys chartarum IBT 7711]|uniref:CCZ1/INTU/HSP4 first Longin domain-containing protein n=1 Tax=Stachybotrys chartarum (strain CBS 109288 / IBT 7711) TaxID=1280523 RepID=A0A084B385_STACB|nr:hypothetical protein S7711_00033 [Stachybotrys chartarum IBT 7711]KFA45940.1 hypothetical protein S40293_07308 [Stachybotrys chartarum IBT 40293]KFA74618.1 hypothetical protein S40288_05805 [Stachybotrys chartarum IBT 40288]